MSLIKNYLHQLQTMNRSELQDNMIQQIIDDMDIKTMAALLYDYFDADYDKYSDSELMEEVKEYYPHLLEPSISELEATADDYGVGK